MEAKAKIVTKENHAENSKGGGKKLPWMNTNKKYSDSLSKDSTEVISSSGKIIATITQLKPPVGTISNICQPASDQYKVPVQLTDLRLAGYFINLYQNSIRYWYDAGKWIDYDGKRWATNSPGGPYKFIKPMLKALLKFAASIQNADTKEDFLKNLHKRESMSGHKSLISMSEKQPQACIETKKLDQNIWLLNCRNGTIHLKTGTIQPHRYDDYITKIVDIEYDPSATCPEFMKFLSKTFDNDVELISYMQRWFGYCLTGSVAEQVFQIWHGTGSNGKGVLSNILGYLLGEYDVAVNSFLLTQRNSGGGDNNTLSELAKLPGKRVARISEIEQNARLAEALIKNMTGGDPITCRALYLNPIVFEPMFKIMLSCNHLPQVRGTDYGIWRRIHKVPFSVTIPKEEQDTNLTDKLRGELPGILNWAIAGCMAWQKIGLNPPAVVIAATAEYQNSEDMFASWLQECCVLGGMNTTKASLLLESYVKYSGWKGMSHKKFGGMLKEHGFEKSTSNGVVWHGLELLEPLDGISEKSDGKTQSGGFPKNASDSSNSPATSMYADML